MCICIGDFDIILLPTIRNVVVSVKLKRIPEDVDVASIIFLFHISKNVYFDMDEVSHYACMIFVLVIRLFSAVNNSRISSRRGGYDCTLCCAHATIQMIIITWLY